jgi:hypothetical protein
MAPAIYEQILQHGQLTRPFPEEVFIGSPEKRKALQAAMGRLRYQ